MKRKLLIPNAYETFYDYVRTLLQESLNNRIPQHAMPET